MRAVLECTISLLTLVFTIAYHARLKLSGEGHVAKSRCLTHVFVVTHVRTRDMLGSRLSGRIVTPVAFSLENGKLYVNGIGYSRISVAGVMSGRQLVTPSASIGGLPRCVRRRLE